MIYCHGAQALLSIEGLLHPRAPPLQLRVDVAAAAAAADGQLLTLGQPRFWSAAMPVEPGHDESGAEDMVPDAERGAHDMQYGSAHVDSSADVPLIGDQARNPELDTALKAVPGEQPLGSLAAVQSAAAGALAAQAAEHVQPASDQAQNPPVAPPRKHAAHSERLLDIAAVSDVIAPAKGQDPSGAVPAPALIAVKAPAASTLSVPSTFQNQAESDSEGPMPSIDSGPSDSESEE